MFGGLSQHFEWEAEKQYLHINILFWSFSILLHTTHVYFLLTMSLLPKSIYHRVVSYSLSETLHRISKQITNTTEHERYWVWKVIESRIVLITIINLSISFWGSSPWWQSWYFNLLMLVVPTRVPRCYSLLLDRLSRLTFSATQSNPTLYWARAPLKVKTNSGSTRSSQNRFSVLTTY